MSAELDPHGYLSDEVKEWLLRDCVLSDEEIANVNALCEAWGDEELTSPDGLQAAKEELRQRILKALDIRDTPPVGRPGGRR